MCFDREAPEERFPERTPARNRSPVPQAIVQGRIVAIGRRLDALRVQQVADALVDSGIHAFEVTLDSDGALQAIAKLRDRYDGVDLLVGAGTIKTTDEAAASVAAGARFLVTPFCHLGVIRWAVDRGIPVIPGAFTPTEIMSAWSAGATAVKLFPASAVGPTFIREMRGPLPEVPLVPTGGITLDNAAEFLRAGAVAIGMGSWLTGKGDDTSTIRERAARLVAALTAGEPV